MAEYRYCQVITTTDSRESAEALASSVVQARLAASAQVSGPIASTYWWKGKIESTQEWHVIFKAELGRYPPLEEHIRANHTYEVPEIYCTPMVAGYPAYLEWISTETAR